MINLDFPATPARSRSAASCRRKSAEIFLAHFEEIGLLQQRVDDFSPLLRVREVFQNREMIEHHFRYKIFLNLSPVGVYE